MTNTIFFYNTIRDDESTTTEEVSSSSNSYTTQPGLSGNDDFAISIAAWEARKIRYLHPPSGFHNFDTTSDQLHEQPEPELVRESGATTSSDKRGIEGIRPPLLTRPPSIHLNDDDDDSSSTTTDPMYITSPKPKFKINIKLWTNGALLGRGSFGTVYEGLSDDGFFFAVKEVSLLDQGNQAKQCIYQLEQEISLLSQLEHENIVQYLGTEKDKKKIYIFLELVTKGSLAQLYRRYHLIDSQVSAYTRQILHGLKYLHDRKVVHRDVKCANILIDGNGSVKLANFGIAKATKLNHVKSCRGTAFWMAPEVVRSRGCGLASDIWSLGCTVLEMLTRQVPCSPLGCAEVNYLGRLYHPNLVRLLGYCSHYEERLLVYEFMPRGSLADHLFENVSTPLSWSVRMKIALGAAKGLAFLHSAPINVIHRNFKSSIILLDMDYNAKLSGFGLAMDGPTGDESHVSTEVMGTRIYAAPEYISTEVMGTRIYAAPEYIATGHLTAKCDVYAFGVVLLEMLSGRRVYDADSPFGEHYLVEWLKPYLTHKRKAYRMADSRLKGQYSLKGFQKVANLALICLSGNGKSRPNMDEVVKVLGEL